MGFEKETLGFWEKLMKLKDKYGYWKLTKLVLFVAFAVFIILFTKNFAENFTFDYQRRVAKEAILETQYETNKEHHERMEVRQSISPLIISILQKTLIEMSADRCFILELHNGSNNPNGLPFVHCTMTYEETLNNICSISEDYQNISLSRFTFSEYLHKNNIWIGSIEELAQIDKKLSDRMKSNDTQYIVMTSIITNDTVVGYYGFSYCKSEKILDKQKITTYVVGVVQKLSKLLDGKVISN